LIFCMGEESEDTPPSLDPNPYKILQHRQDTTTLKQVLFVRSPIRITTTQRQWSAYSSLSLSLSLSLPPISKTENKRERSKRERKPALVQPSLVAARTTRELPGTREDERKCKRKEKKKPKCGP
jgi:hypothetical protein